VFHHTPRLDSTLDSVTVFNFAEPYINNNNNNNNNTLTSKAP